MRKISLNTQLRVSPDVVMQDLGGELVVLDPRSETYFGFDEISTRTWQLLEPTGRLIDVQRELEAEYVVPPTQLSADLISFAQHLLAKRLLRID